MLPSGATVTWRELEQRSRRCAAALLAAGLRTGDVVAVFLENHPRYFELLWAAHRIGLYYTTISRHLKREEAQYIIADCDARVLFHSSHTQAELDPARLDAAGVIRISMDGAAAGAADYEDWLARQPEDVSLPDTPEGTDFLYSSGTTGLPKGIKRPLAQANRYFRVGEAPSSAWKAFGPDTVYLSTAPFYHAAPVRWNMAVLRAGGSCVMLEKFDAAAALAAIAAHRVTHSQWVPTMFIRLLRLPDEERARHDLSSLRYAVRGRAVPGRGQAGHDPLVGADPVRVLQRHRAGRAHLAGLRGMAGASRLGGPARVRPGAYRQRDGERELPPGQPGVIYFSAAAPSNTTRIRPRRARPTTRAAGPPMATSATWTRTAICT